MMFLQKNIKTSRSAFSSLMLAAVLLLMMSGLMLAQGQKGKISGRVFDDATGEALAGANVLIPGTKNGATCDVNGRFVILNLQPGEYSVSASMVGYATLTVRNVEVTIDHTTEVNFRLKDKSVQTTAVEIVAQRQKVIKDQTASASTINTDQIKNAPVEGLRGVIDLSTSFQKTAQGDYQVRGSSTNEVSFQINGVEQVNSSDAIPGWGGSTKANNSWKYDVNPLGVQQLQMITGGFSAEYGNAQAAVVKVVTKEGGPKFTGEFRFEYRPEGQYHWGDYLYDQSSYEWQKWGNYDWWLNQKSIAANTPANNIFTDLSMNKSPKYAALYNKVFITKTATPEELAQWEEYANHELRWAYDTWVKNHTPSEDNPLGVYDYRKHTYQSYRLGFGGPLGKNPDLMKFFLAAEYKKNPTRIPSSEKDQIYQNYILTFTSQFIKDHKIKFMGGYKKYVGGLFSGSEDIRWSGISPRYKYHVNRDPVRTEENTSQSLNYVYTINNESFLETTVSHQYEKYELPYRAMLTWYDQADYRENSTDTTGYLIAKGRWHDDTYFDNYENIGTDFYNDNRTDSWSLKADYTNQILKTNMLKTGFAINYWDLKNTAVTYNFLAYAYIGHQGMAENYKAYPINFSFYIQDKMEYEGMIASFGLRAEAFNYQCRVPVDMFNVFYQGLRAATTGNPETVDSDTKIIVLPRIGLSFPIGENTAFRLHYGHFTSMPVFSQVLGNSTMYGWSRRGNPNLDFKKTIQYEFGLQQLLDEDNRLDVSFYYNDRVSQIGNVSIAAYTGDTRDGAGFTIDNKPLYFYDSYDNNLFGSTIGTEIILESVSNSNLAYRISYSLSQTTSGSYGSLRIYPDKASSYQSRAATTEGLAYSDRTHSFRALLQYSFREAEGFELFGLSPLENSVFALIYTAQSGEPYTYIRSGIDIMVNNNRRWPIESSVDFNFSKNLKISGADLILGLRVMNVFNNRWVTPMSISEDRYQWIDYGVNIDQGYNRPNVNNVIAQYTAYKNIPRQIFFTIGIGVN